MLLSEKTISLTSWLARQSIAPTADWPASPQLVLHFLLFGSPHSSREPEIAASAICGATNPATATTAAATMPGEDFLPFARLVSAAATKVPVFSHQMLLYDLFTIFPSSKKRKRNSYMQPNRE